MKQTNKDSRTSTVGGTGLQKGYTFVAEARTVEQPLMSGAWRMRLIGSLSPLPTPRTTDVNSNFQVKEIRDYYLPNPKDIIFRWALCRCMRHQTWSRGTAVVNMPHVLMCYRLPVLFALCETSVIH